MNALYNRLARKKAETISKSKIALYGKAAIRNKARGKNGWRRADDNGDARERYRTLLVVRVGSNAAYYDHSSLYPSSQLILDSSMLSSATEERPPAFSGVSPSN